MIVSYTLTKRECLEIGRKLETQAGIEQHANRGYYISLRKM